MKSLERKIVNKEDLGPLPQQEEPESARYDSPRSATETEKARYGTLLPRTGVHFIPDSKVVDFLKYGSQI